MQLSTVYSSAWITWVTAFFIIEFSALFTGNNRFTLSEYIWRLEEINASWTFLRYLVACLTLWLFLHMTFGILR